MKYLKNTFIKDKKLNELKNCENYNNKINENYCSNCRKPIELKRINRQYLIKEIGSILNFEKGFFFTVKEILLKPGLTIENFILKDRNRIVKPVTFLIICSIIFTIAHQIFKIGNDYPFSNYDWRKSVVGKVLYIILNNRGYSNIILAVFISIWTKFFFRKHNYNYYEIYILLCFTTGISTLISTLFGILESISGYSVYQFGINIALLYVAWAIGRFFGKKKILNYLKGLISYILGMATFIIAFGIIKKIIEFLIQ